MWVCDVRKRCLIFWLFFIHIQSVVRASALGQFSHLQYYGPSLDPVAIQNPCPNFFQYRYDENGILFGLVQVPIPDTNLMELDVEFVVANLIGKGQEGSITLPYADQELILESIQRKIPLNYKVNFPAWQGIPPKITKIVFNDNLICLGESYPLSAVAVLTIIHLLHKLNIKVPTQSDLIDNPNLPTNDNDTDHLDSSIDADNVDHPRNFKPKDAYRVPKIVYKLNTDGNPFYDSPFLNRLYSTASRPPFQGNPFFTMAPSTEATLKTVTAAPQKRQLASDPSRRHSKPQHLYEECGLPIITNSLILHGQRVPRGAYPWLVAIFHTSDVGLSYKCTGVLISKKHVVTAAHCVDKQDGTLLTDNIVMVLGRTDLRQWNASDGAVVVEAEDVQVHPNYTSRSADADIAVVELRKEVVFSTIIRPICLWDGDDDLSLVVGKTGLVIGWGKDETGSKFSPEPKEIEMPIVSQERCLRSGYAYRDITSERTFCAGKRDGAGPCSGDSGGGFVMKDKERWFLRGIVSMSLSDVHVSCDLSNYVVFTDASKHNDWLLSFLK